MRGLNSLIVTFLLLVLIVSAQEGSGSDNDSSDEADVDQTDQISDNLGPSGDEACDDCEAVISSLGRLVSNDRLFDVVFHISYGW